MKHVLFGIFQNASRTKSAVDKMKSPGYGRKHISVIAQYFPKTDEKFSEVSSKEAVAERILEGEGPKSNLSPISTLLIRAEKFDFKKMGSVVMAGPVLEDFKTRRMKKEVEKLAKSLQEFGLSEDEIENYIEQLGKKKVIMFLTLKKKDLEFIQDIFKDTGARHILVKEK